MPQSEYSSVAVINSDDKKTQENVMILDDNTIEFEESNREVELLYRTKSKLDVSMLIFLFSMSSVLLFLTLLFYYLTRVVTVSFIVWAILLLVLFVLLRPRTLEIYSDRLEVRHFVLKSVVKLSQIQSVTSQNNNCFCFSLEEVVVHRMIGGNLELHPRFPNEFASFLRFAMSPGTHLRPPLRFEEWESPSITV